MNEITLVKIEMKKTVNNSQKNNMKMTLQDSQCLI